MISLVPEEREVPAGRVLVVDDDREVGKALARLCHPAETVFAQSAAGALARIEAGGKFGAIVCDLRMPSMTGMELHRRIGLIAPAQARRMVFVTGSADEPDAAAFLRRTSCEWLEKPVSGDQLRAAIARAAQR
jgi:CheY-like chemotaxis protein